TSASVSMVNSTISGAMLSGTVTGIYNIANSTFGGALTVNAGADLAVSNNTSLTLLASGIFTNNGTLRLASAGNNTNLFVSGGTVTLSGTGSVTTGNNGANRILGAAASDGLIIAAGQTVQGSGQLGVNQLVLTNNGTIEANQSNALTVDLTNSAPF